MKVWLRRAGIAAGALLVVVLLALGAVYGMSASLLGTGHTVASPHPFDASGGDAAEGQRLTNLYGCTSCHVGDLGGQVLVDGMPFARVASANLTAGRTGGPLTDEQFERAVRHGIGADGRSLFIMPSSGYTYLSDQDLRDILAYIRTVPSVTRELPKRKFGPIGRTLAALGKLPFESELIANDPNARHLTKPSPDHPVQLGYYLTRLCAACHGPQLAGGVTSDPESPPSANLTAAGHLKGWTYEQFREVFRTGITPEGKHLDPRFMPWTVFGQAKPEELAAIWAYLRTLPAVQTPATQ